MNIILKFQHIYYICYLVNYKNRLAKQVEYHINISTKKIVKTTCRKINQNSLFFNELDVKIYPIKNIKHLIRGK